MIADELLDLIGRIVPMRVQRKTSAGYIVGEANCEILLPMRLVTATPKIGEIVSVFVHTDSEDRPIATMKQPLAQRGDFAFLKVVDHNQHGCFLYWGLDKDLFCPNAEQHAPMKIGHSYVVAVYLDNHTGRVAAASKLAEFFDYEVAELKPNQSVDLLVYGFQDRGAQVVVDDRYAGLVYSDQNFTPLKLGDRLKGYIDVIRPDNKLDIRLRDSKALHPIDKIVDARQIILKALNESSGSLPLGDKSSPEAIYHALGVSKKAFKAAVGHLYRKGLVVPGPTSTALATPEQKDPATS